MSIKMSSSQRREILSRNAPVLSLPMRMILCHVRQRGESEKRYIQVLRSMESTPVKYSPEHVENMLCAYRLEGFAEVLLQGEQRRLRKADVAETSRMDEQAAAVMLWVVLYHVSPASCMILLRHRDIHLSMRRAACRVKGLNLRPVHEFMHEKQESLFRAETHD